MLLNFFPHARPEAPDPPKAPFLALRPPKQAILGLPRPLDLRAGARDSSVERGPLPALRVATRAASVVFARG